MALIMSSQSTMAFKILIKNYIGLEPDSFKTRLLNSLDQIVSPFTTPTPDMAKQQNVSLLQVRSAATPDAEEL